MRLPPFIGRFEVRQEIARGGFAVVALGWDGELESFVALKILLPEFDRDDAIQLRFLEEARLLRRIRSASVVTVHDIGRLEDGRPYFVMDYADRGTLEPRLLGAAVPPDPRTVLTLVDALADGLAAVHDAGVVHRDIKPANVLFQRARRASREQDGADPTDAAPHALLVAADERVILGDLGIAKDVSKHGSLATLLGGTPQYRAPEQVDADAQVTAAADIYAATGLLWHVLTGQRPPEAHSVPSRLSALPAEWHEVMERGMALDPAERFANARSWHSAIHDALGGESGATPAELPTELVGFAGSCPYKGLAAYQPEDAPFFFGREALIDALVLRLQGQRVLVVGGSSGSGKSSLVRAGLIPALQAGALPESDTWRIALMTPGRDPMAELHFQLTRAHPGAAPGVSIEELLARPTLARHLSGADASAPPVVLCIDQFEELFTLAPGPQQGAFIAALAAMTDPADSKVRVVIAVRADFYAACAQQPWLAERITENQVIVGPMSGAELRRAANEPARRAGLYLERDLLDALIDEASREAGSLPLLAHALVETWVRRQGTRLTLDGFRAAGGVAGAISQTADATFEQRFDAAEQEAAKRLFLRLVAPGEGTPDTRRVLARAEIDNDPQPDVIGRVVERLTEARLLTVDDTSVQIAHEAMLRTWPRLRAWIQESRDDLRTRQRISHAAVEWDAQGRDPDLLYRGTPLLSALDWAQQHGEQLGELDRAFLDAAAGAKAQAEAAEQESARRTRRVRRVAVAALSALALGATLASVIALLAFRDAQRSEELAERASAQARERFAGALGAVAHGLVEDDPLLALVLAAEAVARTESGVPGYEARAALVGARQRLARPGPVLLGSPIPVGDALAIALDPTGSLLAAGRRGGEIVVIDTATQRPVGPSLLGHAGGVEDLDFGPRGRRLASAGDDGTVRLWTVGDGSAGEARIVGKTDDVVWAVRFDPAGGRLASAGQDGTVRLWDAVHGRQIGEPLIDLTSDFLSVAFSPDGKALVAGNGDGEVHGWAVPSGEALFAPVREAHTSDVWELVFSPRGDRFATASSDGSSMVLAFPAGQVIAGAFSGVGKVAGLVFTRDGSGLVAGDDDGALRLWHLERNALAETAPRGHSRAVIDADLSRDGELLATLGRDQLVRLWRFGDATPLAQVRRVGGRSAKGVAIADDGARLAAGDEAGGVLVWELAGAADPMALPGHRHQVWAVAFARDGKRLASGDRSGQVRVWDPITGASQTSIDAHADAVWSLAFTPDGRRLVSASGADVRLWATDTYALEAVLPHDGAAITRAALSPDGDTLATATAGGRVKLWDLASAQARTEIAAADDVVWSVAFAPHGRELATGSSDEVLAVWDIATGRQRLALAGHAGGATAIAYLGDGVTVVALDRSGRLHLWDLRTGKRLVDAWQAHAAASWRLAAHPDGERFATAGDDGSVKLWDVLSVARACAIAGPTFDAARRGQYLGEGEPSLACDKRP